jgi:hypothetical protein
MKTPQHSTIDIIRNYIYYKFIIISLVVITNTTNTLLQGSPRWDNESPILSWSTTPSPAYEGSVTQTTASTRKGIISTVQVVNSVANESTWSSASTIQH